MSSRPAFGHRIRLQWHLIEGERSCRSSTSTPTCSRRSWLELLQKEGGIYNIKTRPDGQREIFRGDTPVVLPQPGHFDYDLRIKHMDAAGIDVSIVSLTCPNVYWGNEEISCRAARESNDNMQQAQSSWPDRIRWFTSLPWEYPARAVAGAGAQLRERRRRRDGAGQRRRAQPDRPPVRADLG